MNNYIKPELEIVIFEATSIVMTSGNSRDTLNVRGKTIDNIDASANINLFE